MNPNAASTPLTLDEVVRLAVLLARRGHHEAAVATLARVALGVMIR